MTTNYEIERAKLIRDAMRSADEKAGKSVGLSLKWNRIFLSEMDRMAYEAGLISWNPALIHKGYLTKTRTRGKTDDKNRTD